MRRCAPSVLMIMLGISVARPALANGRFPASTSVATRTDDAETMLLGLTLGLLISRDGGAQWRWMCEESIGYGGIFDPEYAVGDDGTIYATTLDGLRVSRDGGCTFTTATEEQPDGPTRLAGIWVDSLDLAPDGAVWVATAEAGRENDVYRSNDRGDTFMAMGLSSTTIFWKSVLVARTVADRIYVSGYQSAPTPELALRRSDDGGKSWSTLGVDGIALGSTLVTEFVAIDPADVDVVYLKSANAGGDGRDHLYRSADGGQTWQLVLETEAALRGIIHRAGSGEVIVATGTGGLHRSADGVSFNELASAPEAACITERSDGVLYACGANWQPDFFILGRSPDASAWEPVLRFHEMAGPVSCSAGTTQYDVCELQIWPGIREQFVVTGPLDASVDVPPTDPGGCCDGGGRRGSLVLTTFVLGALYATRRRRNRKHAQGAPQAIHSPS